MMTQFYSIQDNSLETDHAPWIMKIVSGEEHHQTPCPECGRNRASSLVGDVEVLFDPAKGTYWPDALGCGATPVLIVTRRVLEAWKADKIRDCPVGGRLKFMPPLPRYLQKAQQPEYFWLDSTRMVGARLDDEASGFIISRSCPICGCSIIDVDATYDRQHSQPWSYVFAEGTWNGADLFTISPTGGLYFCTERVVTCAREHGHTNFRFVPVEEGDAPGSSGINYM
jgi:hypothetical protein